MNSCLRLAGAAILAASTCSHADPVEPLSKIKTPPPRKAQVLLISSRLDAAAGHVIQKALDDTALVFRVTEDIPSAGALAAGIDRWVGNKKWDVIFLDAPLESAPDTILSRLRSSAKAVVQGGGKFPPAAPALVVSRTYANAPDDLRQAIDAIVAGLLQDSPRWAELPADEKRDPRLLASDPRLLKDPDSIPLTQSETATVYRAQKGVWQFNMHPFITWFDGRFWVIFSSGLTGEDGPGQFIQYSTSLDGLKWDKAQTLVAAPDGPKGPRRWMPGGLYVRDGKLYALGSVHRGGGNGRIWNDVCLHRFVWQDGTWQDEGVIAEDSLVYYPPLRIGEEEFIVRRNSYAHIATAVSKTGTGNWTTTKMPGPPPDYRLSETSAYADPSGAIHLIMRDQGNTLSLYHTVSFDRGRTWTLPVKTNYPDAMSKNRSGRLSDGRYFLISNPLRNSKLPGRIRELLAISFSRDGWTFGDTMAIRNKGSERRYEGENKPSYTFQYADALEHGGKLWIIYSTNKEDIEITAIPLSSLPWPAEG